MDSIAKIIDSIRFVWKIFNAIIVDPLRKVTRFCQPAINWYKKKWVAYTYDKFDDFIYKRGFVMIIYTIVLIYLILSIFAMILDIGYYLATKKVETIYLSDSVELTVDESLWGVKGCPTASCESTSALYFRIKNSWFNQAWNIIHNHQLFFPDIVAAGVPTGQTKCEVVSYGLRFRILMMYNIYPQILQVKCYP